MQTWTFGPNGIYTATWDGVGKVTITLTASGLFVAAFAAQSLTAAIASPEYQAILSPAPTAPLALSLVATTGVSGFALQNATPNIISWTAPNDGQMHRYSVFSALRVTSTETGGTISVAYTLPDGTAASHSLFAGSLAAGDSLAAQPFLAPIQAGSTVTVKQSGAMSAGAAVIWAELWGS